MCTLSPSPLTVGFSYQRKLVQYSLPLGPCHMHNRSSRIAQSLPALLFSRSCLYLRYVQRRQWQRPSRVVPASVHSLLPMGALGCRACVVMPFLCLCPQASPPCPAHGGLRHVTLQHAVLPGPRARTLFSRGGVRRCVGRRLRAIQIPWSGVALVSVVAPRCIALSLSRYNRSSTPSPWK